MRKNIHIDHKKFRTWTPGKLMLLGEHAVVYGYSCISLAIDKGVTVTVTNDESDTITSDVSDTRFAVAAREAFRQHFSKNTPVHILIQSDISGFGLGSSSAVTVGIVSALMGLYDISCSLDEIFGIAYRVVKSIQKSASGYDVATSLYGGIIEFNGETKKVKRLPVSTFPFLVGFSGKKADTAQLVEKVSKARKNNREKVDAILANISHLVEKGEKALVEKNWVRFGKYMNKNQQLLESLGVSTPILDRIIQGVQKETVLGAKISGAGGGDCVIILSEGNNKENIVNAVQKAGATYLPLRVSPKGVHKI